MMKVGVEFVGVVCGFIRILCFGRQITKTILAVFKCSLFLFDLLLSDNSVEWVEFKNLFKPGTV
jgi:hypothetical protein